MKYVLKNPKEYILVLEKLLKLNALEDEVAFGLNADSLFLYQYDKCWTPYPYIFQYGNPVNSLFLVKIKDLIRVLKSAKRLELEIHDDNGNFSLCVNGDYALKNIKKWEFLPTSKNGIGIKNINKDFFEVYECIKDFGKELRDSYLNGILIREKKDYRCYVVSDNHFLIEKWVIRDNSLEECKKDIFVPSAFIEFILQIKQDLKYIRVYESLDGDITYDLFFDKGSIYVKYPVIRYPDYEDMFVGDTGLITVNGGYFRELVSYAFLNNERGKFLLQIDKDKMIIENKTFIGNCEIKNESGFIGKIYISIKTFLKVIPFLSGWYLKFCLHSRVGGNLVLNIVGDGVRILVVGDSNKKFKKMNVKEMFK
jgi:hypothetical protein